MASLDVAAARQELQTKTLLDIERATARTWGARACACYDLAHEARDAGAKSRRLEEAQNYWQEALEHAAMTEDIRFLQELLSEMDGHRKAQLKPQVGRTAGA
jgi:hypothetical protein